VNAYVKVIDMGMEYFGQLIIQIIAKQLSVTDKSRLDLHIWVVMSVYPLLSFSYIMNIALYIALFFVILS
jgi:hypothetical protein